MQKPTGQILNCKRDESVYQQEKLFAYVDDEFICQRDN